MGLPVFTVVYFEILFLVIPYIRGRSPCENAVTWWCRLCFLLLRLTSILLHLHSQERKLRKKIHNRLLEIQGNIRVICRVRPILEVERRSGEDVDVTEVPNDEELFVQRDQQVSVVISGVGWGMSVAVRS